jgi:hypothetical protein
MAHAQGQEHVLAGDFQLVTLQSVARQQLLRPPSTELLPTASALLRPVYERVVCEDLFATVMSLNSFAFGVIALV